MEEPRRYVVKYVPRHAFRSVIEYLFPERVGRKYKAKYAVPIGGEFVVDVDSFIRRRWNARARNIGFLRLFSNRLFDYDELIRWLQVM